MKLQICTPEFVAWLNTTCFAGVVRPGEQWDTEAAWPSSGTMAAARECFDAFTRGDLATAAERMIAAQKSFV